MCTPAPVDLFRISCQSTCVPGTTPCILHSCSRPLIRRILVTMHSRYHPRYRCQCVTPPSLSRFESPPLSHTLRAPCSHILWEPPTLTYVESPHITAVTASGSHVPTPHFVFSFFCSFVTTCEPPAPTLSQFESPQSPLSYLARGEDNRSTYRWRAQMAPTEFTNYLVGVEAWTPANYYILLLLL